MSVCPSVAKMRIGPIRKTRFSRKLILGLIHRNFSCSVKRKTGGSCVSLCSRKFTVNANIALAVLIMKLHAVDAE